MPRRALHLQHPPGHCSAFEGELLLDLDELCVQALDEALRHTGDHVAHGFGGHLLHHVPHADAGLDVEEVQDQLFKQD